MPEGLYKAVEVKASDEKYDISESTYYFGIGGSREGKKTLGVDMAIGIGGEGRVCINDIIETNDDGYVAVGRFWGTINIGNEEVTGNGDADGIIIKYNVDGEIEWYKIVGGTWDDNIHSVITTNDEEIIVLGWARGTIYIEDEVLT